MAYGLGIIDVVREVCLDTLDELRDPALRAEVRELTRRLEDPLRVAIAGPVKAGKSTLLNALVGERVAPTTPGECTRLASWYRYGPAGMVHAVGSDGARTELSFTRDDDALVIDLGSLSAADVDRLEVQWPAAALRSMTLIDSPGIVSATARPRPVPVAPLPPSPNARPKPTSSSTCCATCTFMTRIS